MSEAALDQVITSMYASMCFDEGEEPAWSQHSELFAPGARLVRINDEGVFAFDLRTFRENIESMISSGMLSSFWEGEVSRETRVFGDVAHVLSCYETRTSSNGTPLGRAVKSIQLFQEHG